MTNRREREKHRKDFIARQFSELYGPLGSLRAGIRARSELRAKLDWAFDRTWRKKTDADHNSLEPIRQFSCERSPAFKAVIKDNNTTFKTVLLADYQQMLTTFREKMWLAEPETRAHFPALVESVDIWERVMREALPGEVLEEIQHSEKSLHPFYKHLHPFYKHLEERHDLLRAS